MLEKLWTLKEQGYCFDFEWKGLYRNASRTSLMDKSPELKMAVESGCMWNTGVELLNSYSDYVLLVNLVPTS